MDSAPLNYFEFHGDVVAVRFLDHALGEEAFDCEVFGVLVFEDEKLIRIRYWHCHDKADDDTNHEHIVIIKSAITHFVKLA